MASLFIGVGLFARIVTTLVAPLLPVVVTSSVTTEGVLVVVCPALFVVTITTVDCKVVCGVDSARFAVVLAIFDVLPGPAAVVVDEDVVGSAEDDWEDCCCCDEDVTSGCRDGEDEGNEEAWLGGGELGGEDGGDEGGGDDACVVC